MSGFLSKPLILFCLETYLYCLMICSMDTSNVIYLFKNKFIETILFYSILKSNFVGFRQCQLQAILPKRVAILKNKMKKIIQIYVLDIPNIRLSYYTQII